MSFKSLQELYERALTSAGRGSEVSCSKKFNEISIGALERGVRTLAKKLEQIGLTSEIDVFKTGPGGAQHYGPSYVTLAVVGTVPSTYGEPGDTDDATVDLKFFAGGYGDGSDGRRGQFGGSGGWSYMSEQAQDYIMKELIKQGWKFPESKKGK